MWGKTTPWGIAVAGSFALPIIALFVWSGSWWPEALFAIWTLVAFAIWRAASIRKHREQSERMLHRAQVSSIQTLSHHRHDWMNELQVLYGYLRLNKPDKAVAVVDRIRERMEQDSKLSRLGIAELIVYLLSFRTICDSMKLDVEVEDGLQLDRLNYDAGKLTDAVIGIVNTIRFRAAASTTGEDNVLRLVFKGTEAGVALEIAYKGELAATDSVREEIERCLKGIGQLATEDRPAAFDLQTRGVEIHFPLPA